MVNCIKKIFVILILLSFISTYSLYAQRDRIRFEKLTIEQGLSQSSIVAICQDYKGFLWFGTYDGLNRYDGYEFKIFRHKPNDPTSLSQNLIRDIYEDRSGILWIGTEGGLNKYDRDKETFTRYLAEPNDPKSISNNRIRDIYEDRNGAVWIATEGGLNRYERANESFKKYYLDPDNPNSLSHNLIRVILEDSSGNFYLGTNAGLYIFDRQKENFIHCENDPKNANSINENSITCLVQDTDGSIWIGSAGGGLRRFDKKNKNIKRYQFNQKDPKSLRHNVVRALCIDGTGELWIGTYGGGLDRYDRKNDCFIHYQYYPNDPQSLSSNAVWSIYEDRSGILWIGTDFGGVNKFDRRKEQFTYYTYDPNNLLSLNNNKVNAIFEDPVEKGKTVWIGTWGGGLSRFDRNTEQFTPYLHSSSNSNSLSNNVVRCINKDSYGFLWIGTDDGLNKFDHKKNKFVRYQFASNSVSSLSHNMIKAIYEDKSNNLWIGTYRGGLEKYDRVRDQFIHYQHNPSDTSSLSDNIIWCIYEDRSGRLWIGTDAGGLNCFDRQKEKFIHFKRDPNNPNSISDNKVLCIYEDRTGILWVGTAGGGLNSFNSNAGNFNCYTEKDGLPSNTIHAVLEDDQGCLWISTTHGLSRFNKDRNVFTNYNIHDGLQSDEFNVGAGFKGISGELYFGGINGLNIFSPDNIIQNSYVPPILITDFQLFNQSVPIGKEIGGHLFFDKSITETQEMVLSYSDDVFSIEFAALDFTAPSKNNYSYMMSGFEKKWNSVGNRRFATYTKLPAGKYTFMVRGANQSGIWNENGTFLNITITPPFWERWWFRAIVIIIVVGILVISYKIRTARIHAHNRELQQRVSERTIELESANKELEAFAYSVSHDLRAPLRAIGGYTNILIEENTRLLNEEGKRMYGIIKSEISRMEQLIDDFLSLSRSSYIEMNISQINMEEMAHSVFDELTSPVSRERIDFSVAALPIAKGDPVLMRDVWVNLIGNAIKFSSKLDHSKIKVDFRRDDKKTVYLIQDNGAGFDMQYANKLFGVFQRLHSEKEFEGTGVGLAIVQRLIHRHGGQVWAESQVDNGSTFYFTVA